MFSTFMGIILANILFLALHLESRVLPDPLTPKQEKEEFEKYFAGDEKARDKLIKHNLRLVAHVVKKYYQGPIENDDLISIGTIGLIKAVQSFSKDKNVRFSTYASKCIDNAILSQMRLWFRINPPRAKKNTNGVFWHRFPRIFTSFAPLRTAM